MSKAERLCSEGESAPYAATNALRNMQYNALQCGMHVHCSYQGFRAHDLQGFGYFAGEQRTTVPAAEEDDDH